MVGSRAYEEYLEALKGRFTAQDEYEQALDTAKKSGQADYSTAVREQRQQSENWEEFEQRADKLKRRLTSLQSRAGVTPENGSAPLLLRTSNDVKDTLGTLADDVARAEEKLAWIQRNEPALDTVVGVQAPAPAQAPPVSQASSGASSHQTKKSGCVGSVLLLGGLGLLLTVVSIAVVGVLIS
jgi:hypothetical protein